MENQLWRASQSEQVLMEQNAKPRQDRSQELTNQEIMGKNKQCTGHTAWGTTQQMARGESDNIYLQGYKVMRLVGLSK